MTYDPVRQQRCTIIRGRARSDMDNLLPAYSSILVDICPIAIGDFASKFNLRLSSYLPTARTKTLNNHRTEIAGKLFGLYYEDGGIVYVTEQARNVLITADHPKFFRNICYKLQFPNGMDKKQTTIDNLRNRIKIRPLVFVTQLVDKAKNMGISLSVKEVAYYALNSLDVLSGDATPDDVASYIRNDRLERTGIPIGSSSRDMQHIREQINLLQLADLISVDDQNNISLNVRNQSAINIFLSENYCTLKPDPYTRTLDTANEYKKFQLDWSKHYGAADPALDGVMTTCVMVNNDGQAQLQTCEDGNGVATVAIGDEGETYIYNLERRRVAACNRRLVNKVKSLGRVKGLGYDIQTVRADYTQESEFARYLEVKTTKRSTVPEFQDQNFIDVITLTRNEWIAAQQHGVNYAICRVYFTSAGVHVMFIENPFDKSLNNTSGLVVTPVDYRAEIRMAAIDSHQFYNEQQ